MRTIDLSSSSLRDLNQLLHQQKDGTNETQWEILNPKGSHAVAVGVDAADRDRDAGDQRGQVVVGGGEGVGEALLLGARGLVGAGAVRG